VKIFGERLRELRTEKGLSAKALGERIGVSNYSIIAWENNKHEITGENLAKLAKFFNVTSDYLLGLKDD
jgi:transcriptional regulator with XRE-family HTH domain